MYTDWFKLTKLPFRLRPDADFLYLSDRSARVYADLREAASGEYGVACLIGEPGVGKTTLLHALARDYQDSVSVARIQQPDITAEELTATITEQFNLGPQGEGPQSGRTALQRFVKNAKARGRTVAILVDEAHQCSIPILSELLQIAAQSPAPLIVLAGSSALRTSLASLAPLNKPLPIILMLELPRLSKSQIAGYIEFRLKVAGSDGRRLFEPETVAEIWRYTGGTPQLINTLCDSAMMLAEAHSVALVGVVEIREAVQQLNWVEFSARIDATPAT